MSEYIIKGPIIDDNVQMGVGEYFWRTAQKFGDRVFQIDANTGQKETFAETKLRALRVALQLKKLGVQPEDVVQIFCENGMDYIVPTLAALFLGAYVSPAASTSELFDTQYMIKNVKPKVIFVNEKQLEIVKEAITNLDLKPQLCVFGKSSDYPMMNEMEKTETEEESSFRPVKIVDLMSTALILFSSGTTSMPKGICFSHYSVMAGSCRVNGDQSYVLDSPIVSFHSIYWVTVVWLIAHCIINAHPMIVGPHITGEKFYELVDKYKIKHAFISYSSIVEIADKPESFQQTYDISSMQLISLGGAYVDPKYIKQLRTIFFNATVSQSYAGTEIGTAPTGWYGSDKDAYENKSNSVGKPGPNVEIKIVDVTTRQPLGPNMQGEFLVRSPYRMVGFSGNDDSTQVFDIDGFLKTGDIAYYDEQGYFFIVDRLNEIFKFQGFRIFPALMENVIRSHSAVAEVVVFGIHHDVDMFHPVACITLKKNAHVSAQEISDYTANNLSEMYRPVGGVKFFNDMPMTPSGKISRREAKKLFMSNHD